MEHSVKDTFRNLPLADKRVLRYSACFFGDFREDQLTELFALEAQRTREVLNAALQSGILTSSSKSAKQQLTFSSVSLREAIYDSMDAVERADAHFRIGNHLMRGRSAAELKKMTLQVWKHLSQAIDHLQTDSEKQNYFEMSLQLAAGHREVKNWPAVLEVLAAIGDKSAFDPSRFAKQGGMALEREAHLFRYEALSMAGKPDQAGRYLKAARAASSTAVEQAGLLFIHARISDKQGATKEALISCRQGLKLLGLEFPKTANETSVKNAFNTTHRLAQELSEKALRTLPSLKGLEAELLGELLQFSIRLLWVNNRQLAWVLGLKFMQHHIKEGVQGHCYLGFASYGMVMVSQTGQFGLAADMIRLGAVLAKREGGRSPGIHLLKGMSSYLKGALSDGFADFRIASESYLARGRKSESLEPLVALAANQFHAGLPLMPIEKEIEVNQNLAREYNARKTYEAFLVLRYNIRLLSGQSVSSLRDWENQPLSHEILQDILASENAFPLGEWHLLMQMQQAYLLNHQEWATEYFDLREDHPLIAGGQFSFFEVGFYGALAELAARHPARLKISINRIYQQSKWGKSLKKWAEAAPENFSARHGIVEAEKALGQSRTTKLPEAAQNAIALSDKNGSLVLAALARELAGETLFKKGALDKARPLLEEARDLYAKWGAEPKVRRMESRYQLLLRTAPAGLSSAPPKDALPLARVRDAEGLLNSTRIFFSESSLSDLLNQIFPLFFAHCNCEIGSLIIASHSGFKVEFLAELNDSEVRELALSGESFANDRLTEILKTGETGRIEGCELFAKAGTNPEKGGETLCFPVKKDGKPWGLLCFGSGGAIAEGNQDVVEMLATQAGIALENVLRFEELRDRVVHRTNELEETLEYLRNARDQLMESEKLASLGQVTAGIAHEIRNPLNFVNNFSELSIELAGELREEIEELKGKALDDEAIDILEEYLTDLESNAEKIQTHGKRAESIVHNMLMHAASGKGESTKVDLNRLIREYALLAYHGIRGRLTNFVCQLVFDLDDEVGEMNIQQQDISRALLNIFQNGFQAMEEKTHTVAETYKPAIQIKSAVQENKVQIVIRDNGPGISEEVRARIFEPFFTTKPTGKGTGLGLSLAYELVVQGHGGELEVTSQPGEFTEFLITLPLEL